MSMSFRCCDLIEPSFATRDFPTGNFVLFFSASFNLTCLLLVRLPVRLGCKWLDMRKYFCLADALEGNSFRVMKLIFSHGNVISCVAEIQTTSRRGVGLNNINISKGDVPRLSIRVWCLGCLAGSMDNDQRLLV